jgi:nitroreductase
MSLGCLKEYLIWHQQHGYDLGEFGESIRGFVDRSTIRGVVADGGTKSVSIGDVRQAPKWTSADDFLTSRYSCRRYLEEVVPFALVVDMAKVAQSAPSQCNRQSSKLHYYSDPEVISELLRLQGGSEGFRNTVRNLFIVSSELTAWSGFRARNQAYVDGSLVAMQLLLACHSKGLGCCALNLAITNSQEARIRKAGGINDGERLIMMISFGYPLSDSLTVAKSPRASVDTLLCMH